jgi:CheY-like chemotaxis protein
MCPDDPIKTTVAAEPLRLLYVEDELGDVEIALRELKKSKIEFEVETVATRDEFARKLREKAFDIILSDYRLDGSACVHSHQRARP